MVKAEFRCSNFKNPIYINLEVLPHVGDEMMLADDTYGHYHQVVKLVHKVAIEEHRVIIFLDLIATDKDWHKI